MEKVDFMRFFILISMLMTFVLVRAEVLTYEKVLQNLKGLKKYHKGDFTEAEETFKENAIEHPNEGSLQFNHGNALYKAGKLEEAENAFNLALRDKDFNNRSEALQNLGNVKFEQKDYKNAIKHFRDALVEDPTNFNAKYNYELASRYLQRQQQQQQNQNKDSKDDQDKQKEQDKQQQQKNDQQDEQKKKQKQEQQQKQDQQNKDKKEQQKQQQMEQQKKEEQKKEDAEKMLKALLQKEKEQMKKDKMKLNTDKAKKGKYW